MCVQIDYPSNLILITKHLPSSKNKLLGGPGNWILLELCQNPLQQYHRRMKILKVMEPNEVFTIGNLIFMESVNLRGAMAHTFGTYKFAILCADFTLQSLLN